MIRALVVAAIMLVAASLEASAQDRIIFGEAGTSCRTWTQARQTKSRKAGLSAAMGCWLSVGLERGGRSPRCPSGD